MRRVIVLCFLLLATAVANAASGDQSWAISARQPCTGLTAGFTKPLAELNKLVGPRWRAAPGPIKDQGLVLLFVTSCPNPGIAGKPTGAVSSAFVLVPVDQGAHAKKQTHAIAVLQAAGRSGTAVMKLFRTHGIPVNDAHVSLDVRANGDRTHAQAVIHFQKGTLTLTAEMQPDSAPFHSADTLAVGTQPAVDLFSGPENSTRHTKGTIQARATDGTWIQDFELGQPLFVTLDTNFTWDFTFAEPPRD